MPHEKRTQRHCRGPGPGGEPPCPRPLAPARSRHHRIDPAADKESRGFVLVRSTSGAEGLAFANGREQYYYRILDGLVIPYFIGKDARDLEEHLFGVCRTAATTRFSARRCSAPSRERKLWRCGPPLLRLDFPGSQRLVQTALRCLASCHQLPCLSRLRSARRIEAGSRKPTPKREKQGGACAHSES